MKLYIALIKPLLRLQSEANVQGRNDAERVELFVDKVADYCRQLSESETKVVLFLMVSQFNVDCDLDQVQTELSLDAA